MIKVLAKTSNEKGKIFEDFTKSILDRLGYSDFLVRVRKAGRELDIKAKHKVTGQPILVECKAEKDIIGSSELSKFYGVYDHEYQNNKKLVGLFFSLSGFKDTATEYYREKSHSIKNRFKIFHDVDIINLLLDVNLVSSEEVIRRVVSTKVPYSIISTYLCVTTLGVYWVLIFDTEGLPTHFTVVDAYGSEVSRHTCDEIKSLDSGLLELELLNLEARKKIIFSLSDGKDKTIPQIAEEIEESKSDINISITRLVQERLVLKRARRYDLSNELEEIIILFREYLLDPSDDYKFFRSRYVQGYINNRLVGYIQNRFYLNFDRNTIEVLQKLLRISPSALHEALFSSTERYKTGYDQIINQGLGDEILENWRVSTTSDLMNELQLKLLFDFKEKKIRKIYEELDIRCFLIDIGTSIATNVSKYFSIKSHQAVIWLGVAEKPIKAGELLSATYPDVYINIALWFSHLEEYEAALEQINRAILELEKIEDMEKLVIAYTNKGLFLAIQGKYDEAIVCYEHSNKLDPNIKETHYNMGRAYHEKRELKKAILHYKEALRIDPEYENALIYLKEAESDRKKQER